MYLLVLLAIAVFIVVLLSVNKCHDKPFKDEGKCVSKCDNYVDEDGITCVDSCTNFTDEETKKCLAQCPSYKPYSQDDKFCSPYNVLNTETNSFNLKRYSDGTERVLFNELSCSDDSKVIAIKRKYDNRGVVVYDYFISTNFGNNFSRYVADQDEIFSLVKVSPLGECVVVVSNFMITVYRDNVIYSTTVLQKETDTMLHSEVITDYKILDEMTHYYLYKLTHIEKETEDITYKHGIKVSTDYGKTFKVLTEITINDIDLLSGKLCVSKDKKELLFTVENTDTTETNNSKLFTSSDFGKTFTSYEIKGKVSALDCNVNGSCKVITTFTGLTQPEKGYVYVSTDYGLTWKESGIDESITNIKLLGITERGQNQLFLFEKGDSKNGILMSKDYGNTFKIIYESTELNNMVRGAGMTLDSKFITMCTDSTIKTSNDYGETFKQNIKQYANLGSNNVSSQVYISSSNYNYLNGKIQIILGSSNSLFYTTLL